VSKLINLKGKMYGTRKVLRRGSDGPTAEPRWHCRCVDCGRKTLTFGNSLRAKRICVCRRASRHEYAGKRLTISEWAKRLGITRQTFSCRLRALGANNPRAYIRGRLPKGPGGRLLPTNRGSTTVAQAATRLGISKQAISQRLKHGWSEERATSAAKYTTVGGERRCKRCGKIGHYAKTCGKQRRRGT
jgi:hypothetical protein